MHPIASNLGFFSRLEMNFFNPSICGIVACLDVFELVKKVILFNME